MSMREVLEQWINEKDLPELLRTVEALCHERYGRDHDELCKAFWESGRSILRDDYTPEERRVSDVTTAYLCVRAEYIAADFETRVRLAGLTPAERDEIQQREEIEQLEAELERKKKYAQRPNR